MDTALQIFGSLASVGAIPLAVYLYLRNREAKFSKVREDICKVLSYKIGEGRNLSTFEVQAVIDSKLREHSFKLAAVSPDDVIEHLVADTIANPMLESKRKEAIIGNLQNIHQAAQSLKKMERILAILTSGGDADALNAVIESAKTPQKAVPKEEALNMHALSTSFALVATLAGVTALVMGEAGIIKFSSLFSENPYVLKILLGATASVAAGILAYFLTRGVREKGRKEQSAVEKEEASSHENDQ